MTETWLDDDWFENIEYPEEEHDPNQYILGMDPGETTGIAMLRINADDPKQKPELIYLHQIEGGRWGFKEFFAGSSLDDNLTVVSEKWRERNVKGANREPQYIEGGIHMLWGEENVEWQYPDVKDVITDEYLKSQNLWTPGMPHQMDALRHALAYLRNSGHDGTLDTMNPDGDGETIAQPGEAQDAQLEKDEPEVPTHPSEDGEPTEGEGESAPGETEGATKPAKSNFAEMMEAMKEIAEVMEQMGQALEEFEDGPGGYGDVPDDGLNRTKRQRNGAFAGFNPVGDDDEGVTLLDD